MDEVATPCETNTKEGLLIMEEDKFRVWNAVEEGGSNINVA